MKWYIAVLQQTNRAEIKSANPPGRWVGMILSIFACMMLACGFFSSATQPTSPRVVILTRLPTLTPTPLPVKSDSAESVIISATPTETSVLPSEPTPTLSRVVGNNSTVAATVSIEKNEPLLTSLVALNVRRGPGAAYEVVGKLAEGQSTKVLGRNVEGTWWQIVYPPDSGNTAWVSADSAYSTVSSTDEILVAQAPDLPTATATAVATDSPSVSPTSTQVDQTNTPEPTVKPTTAPKVIPTVSESGGWFR
jgi:uncharacterized protein YgiM (DUF1202 family)